MKYLPLGSFVRLMVIIAQQGGVPARSIMHLLPWLIKTILLEPFRLLELVIFERKIRNHQLKEDPIFILGHYRSGTTFLYRILMQNRQLGYMTMLQSVAPEFMLLLEKPLTPLLEMIAKIFKMRNHFHRLPLSWDFPGEDDVGMTALVTPLGSQWGVMFPENFKDQFNKNVLNTNASWLNQYQYLVRKISMAANGKQLVLKSPPNTARVKELLKAYPNAKFIYIHRNPMDVYGSSVQFWDTILREYVLGRSSDFNKHETILWQYEKMISAYLDQKYLIPEENLTEVAYQDLINDPSATVESIFRILKIKGYEESRYAMDAFIETQRTYEKLKHKNNPNAKEISIRWKKIFDHWSYPTPQTNHDDGNTAKKLSEIS